MARTPSQNVAGMEWPKFMDFTNFAEQFKMPGVDPKALFESQRKNLEAFSAAQAIALEAVQAVSRRQVEIMRELMEESAGAVREMTSMGKPEEKLAKQTELFKQSFEHSLANLRELAEMGAKSNGEAAELINQRITEGLDEIRTAIQKAAAAK